MQAPFGQPPAAGAGPCLRPADVRVQVGADPGGARSRGRPLGPLGPRGPQDPGEARPPDAAEPAEPAEPGGSALAELRGLLRWLRRGLPYALLLSVKLLARHLTGISVGVGLLTAFLYADKSIVEQVFLRERCSKIQCAWLLVFLAGSSALLYYTFHAQSLYYSLIFLNPTLDHSSFWEVLWIIGITDFILKFLFMGLKCLILLVPSFIMPFKSKGYWYMLLEELCQYYRTFVPIPVWFRYLISYGEFGSATKWSVGILLALLYLILKLLDGFAHLRAFRRVLHTFFTRPSYGLTASKRQCSDVDDICSICQAEFQKPILLICQHVFCEECIATWFNREKSCPLCRTVISDHLNKWKDGATSSHLQIY